MNKDNTYPANEHQLDTNPIPPVTGLNPDIVESPIPVQVTEFNGEYDPDEYSLLLNTTEELDDHLETLAKLGKQRQDDGRDPSAIEEELTRLGRSISLRQPENFDKEIASTAVANSNVKRVTIKNSFQGEIADPDLFSSLIGKALGVSSRVKVFLPSACCWVSVTTPSSTAIKSFGYKFLSAIEDERLTTYGVPYQVSQARVFKYAAEFAMKLVVDTNIAKPLNEVVNLKTLSRVDVEILLIAIIASRHTAGTALNVECVVCDAKGTVNINLTDTVRYNLPEEIEQSPVYLNTDTASVSSDEHKEAVRITKEAVTAKYDVSDEISITLFAPSIHEWNERSDLITDYIIGLLEETATTEDDESEILTERLQQLMLENLGVMALLLHTKRIGLRIPEEVFTTNVDGILRALEDLNEDTKQKASLIDISSRWIRTEPLAVHVLYPHTCTNHHSEASDFEPVTTSVLNFFIMKLQTLMQIQE